MYTHTNTTAAWIALNSVKGLGPVGINKLIDHYKSPLALFEKNGNAILKQWVSSRHADEKIDEPEVLLEKAEKQIDTARSLGITIVTLSDEHYPALLKEIYAPPPVLYVKGELSCFSKHSIGVVGTRRPSQYGKNAASELVKQLLAKEIVIVSGLALGIDTICHQTCIDHGGKTIAVFGCGLDKVYPASNKQLADKIAATGALVSEFELGTNPETYNFPRRNRIISGLSAGVLVVEAPLKSGSLITANYALQQGRDVFAVPGSIFSELAAGTFNLLKSGAIPVQSGNDIFENLQTIKLSTVSQNVKETFEQAKPITSIPLDLLSTAEQTIYNCLSSTPQRIDMITENSKTPGNDLFEILLNLELKGLIRQVSGQQFIRAQ